MSSDLVQIGEEPFKVSPTKIKDYASCPRRWFFNYVLDLKPPSSFKMERGTKAHEVLDNYYKTGIKPEDPVLLKALELCPEREEKVISETWLNLIFPFGNIIIRQKADLIDLRNPHCPVIYDFKTMTNFNYAQDEYRLAHDIQMISYAWAVMNTYELYDAAAFGVAHVQIPWNGENPRLVMASITNVELIERWTRIEDLFIKEMEKDSRKSVHEVRANFGAPCKEYGGCAHVSLCEEAEKRREMGELFMDRDGLIKGKNDGPIHVQEKQPVKMSLSMEEVIEKIKEQQGDSKMKGLYVDCIPLNRKVILASEVVAPIMDEVAKETGKGDWRLVDFGKGKGLIQEKLRKVKLPEYVFISKRDDLYSVLFEVLSTRAEELILGVA